METLRPTPRFRSVVRGFLRLAFRLFVRLDVQGLEHIPSTGALIVAPNHLHMMDAVTVFVLVPRTLRVFAADKWRGTIFQLILSGVADAIYVARGEADRASIGEALRHLRAGGALGLAPEGTRSRTGALQAGKDGAAYLAARSGAVIVPVALWGQEETFERLRRFSRATIHVRFADPIRLPPEAARARTSDLAPYTDQIMLALAVRLPPKYRGVYEARVAGS